MVDQQPGQSVVHRIHRETNTRTRRARATFEQQVKLKNGSGRFSGVMLGSGTMLMLLEVQTQSAVENGGTLNIKAPQNHQI